MRLALFPLLIALVMACGVAKLQIEPRIAHLLPDVASRAAILRTLDDFDSQPAVILHLRDVQGRGTDALLAAVEAAAAELEQDARVGSVMAGIREPEALSARALLAESAPLLMDAADPSWRRDDHLFNAVAELREQLLGARGPKERRRLRSDPYSWVQQALQRMGTGGIARRFTLYRGRLLSANRRSAFLLARAPAGTSSTAAVVAAMGNAGDRARTRSPTVLYSVTGPGAAAADGERAVRSDVSRSLGLTALLLPLLFLLWFRHPGAPVWLMAPAALAAAAALGLVAWIGSPIHGLTLAFGAALLGLCVDFPIHALVAAAGAHRGGVSASQAWEQAAARLRRPALACAATSALAFFLLFFSGTPLLRQLAWIGAPAVLIAALLGTVSLPALAAARGWRPAWGGERRLPGGSSPYQGPERRGDRGSTPPRWTGLMVTVSLLALIAGIPGLELDGDPRRIQQLSPERLAAEADFAAVFGEERSPALLAVEGRDMEDVLERAAAVAEALRALPSPKAPASVSSLTDLLPAGSELRRRCEALRGVDLAAWATAMEEAGARTELPPGVFSPLFAHLRRIGARCGQIRSVDVRSLGAGRALGAVVGRFLHLGGLRSRALVQVLPRGEAREIPVAWRAAVAQIAPDAPWIYFPELARRSADLAWKDLARLGGLGLLLSLPLLVFLLGDLRSAALALGTPILAVAGTAGFFGWWGQPLPAVGLGACLLVLGLGLDDGIHVVHALRDPGRGMHAVRGAILLTTITSVIGFGVLALAESPALRAIGQVAVVGLILDLLIALWLLPMLVGRGRSPSSPAPADPLSCPHGEALDHSGRSALR